MAESKSNLGILVPNTNKEKSSAYDLKGSIIAPDNVKNGMKLRVGAYRAIATGDGKMEKGKEYFWLHRLEEYTDMPRAAAPTEEIPVSDPTSFDPTQFEK